MGTASRSRLVDIRCLIDTSPSSKNHPRTPPWRFLELLLGFVLGVRFRVLTKQANKHVHTLSED